MQCISCGKMAALVGGLLLVNLGSARADFVNGSFENGNFNGWSLYTLADGSIGNPTAVPMNLNGTGSGLAARLQVGGASPASGAARGGGLAQSLTLQGGTYHFSIDLASQRPIGLANMDGGTFELIVDGTLQTRHAFGYLAANAVERKRLEADLELAAGVHEFKFQWTRTFRSDDQTPYQFMDNAFLSSDPGRQGGGEGKPPTNSNPAPGGLVLFGIGLATLGVGWLVRRRFAVMA